MRSLLVSFVAALFALGTLQATAQVAETPAQQVAKRVQREDSAKEVATEVVRKLQNTMAVAPTSCIGDCGGDAASPTCTDAYNALYSKDTNISIALGYTDDKGARRDGNYLHAQDTLRRQVWEEKLMRPCPPETDGTCGFTPVAGDAELYSKEVKAPNGDTHKVNVRLSSSSADYYDSNNRVSDGRPKPPCKYLNADVAARTSLSQWRQSCRAATTFYEGLKQSDVVIYAGHARLGGGPDYAPPVLTPGTLETREAAYAGRESETRMLQMLRENPKPPKLIGLFACDADGHFSTDVKTATRGKSGVITSKGLTEPEVVFAQAYAMLDSVLSLRCEDGFKKELDTVRNVALRPRNIGQGVDADIEPFFQRSSARAFSEEDPSAGRRLNTPLIAEPQIRPTGPSTQPPSPNTQSAGGVN